MLASCGADVKLHDWNSGDLLVCISSPDAKTKGFLDITWCNEGSKVVAVPVSGKSLVISVPNALNEREERWRHGKDVVDVAGVRCAKFSKVENSHLVVGTASGEVFLYDVNVKKLVQSFVDLPSGVSMIEYGAQGAYVAASCCNGQIFLYGKTNSVSAAFFIPYSETVTSLCGHARAPNLLAGGSEEGVVAIWDVNSGACTLQAANHKALVLDMAFSTSDDTFITVGDDRKINIYDTRCSDCIQEKQFDNDLTAIAYCPNGQDIALATGRGQIISLDRRHLDSCKSGIKAHKGPIRRISFDATTKVVEPESMATTEVYELKAQGDSTPNKSTSRLHMQKMVDQTTFHIIDEHSLNELRDDIKRANRDVVGELVEVMNNEFLKMRMGVSRAFCTMELRNKKKSQEFESRRFGRSGKRFENKETNTPG